MKDRLKAIKFLLKEPRLRHHLKNSIQLTTIQKSGTNYLRLILTNYFHNYKHKGESMLEGYQIEEVNYSQMSEDIFPNNRDRVVRSQQELKKVNQMAQPSFGLGPYSDFLYDHGSIADTFPVRYLCRPKRTILLYRNPLDTLVSRYYYFYKERQDASVKTVAAMIDSYLPTYFETLAWMQSKAKRRKDHMLISYEQIKMRPMESLGYILDFLGFEKRTVLMEQAVAAASIKKVRDHEKKIGKAIHASEGKSFARSGEIGQWKNYISEDDLDKVLNMMQFYAFDKDEFIFDQYD